MADAAPAIYNGNVAAFPESIQGDCFCHFATSFTGKLGKSRGFSVAERATRGGMSQALYFLAGLDAASFEVGLALFKKHFSLLPGGVDALLDVNAAGVEYLGKSVFDVADPIVPSRELAFCILTGQATAAWQVVDFTRKDGRVMHFQSAVDPRLTGYVDLAGDRILPTRDVSHAADSDADHGGAASDAAPKRKKKKVDAPPKFQWCRFLNQQGRHSNWFAGATPIGFQRASSGQEGNHRHYKKAMGIGAGECFYILQCFQ